jgi:hypothetical protein
MSDDPLTTISPKLILYVEEGFCILLKDTWLLLQFRCRDTVPVGFISTLTQNKAMLSFGGFVAWRHRPMNALVRIADGLG